MWRVWESRPMPTPGEVKPFGLDGVGYDPVNLVGGISTPAIDIFASIEKPHVTSHLEIVIREAWRSICYFWPRSSSPLVIKNLLLLIGSMPGYHFCIEAIASGDPFGYYCQVPEGLLGCREQRINVLFRPGIKSRSNLGRSGSPPPAHSRQKSPEKTHNAYSASGRKPLNKLDHFRQTQVSPGSSLTLIAPPNAFFAPETPALNEHEESAITDATAIKIPKFFIFSRCRWLILFPAQAKSHSSAWGICSVCPQPACHRIPSPQALGRLL